MISTDTCIITANFDSGTFKHIGVSPPDTSRMGQNIQSYYNLSFEDFTTLEILIAGIVNKYLKSIGKNYD